MKKQISRRKKLSALSCDIDSFIDFIVDIQDRLFSEECSFSLTIYLKNDHEETIEFDSLSEFRRENQKLLPARIKSLSLRLSSCTKKEDDSYSHKSINFIANNFSGSLSADSEDEKWCDYAIHILEKFPSKHRVWYSFIKNDNYFWFLWFSWFFIPAIWLSIFKTSLFSIFGNQNASIVMALFCLSPIIFAFTVSTLPLFTLRTKTQEKWIQKYHDEIIIYGTLFGGIGGIVSILSLFKR